MNLFQLVFIDYCLSNNSFKLLCAALMFRPTFSRFRIALYTFLMLWLIIFRFFVILRLIILTFIFNGFKFETVICLFKFLLTCFFVISIRLTMIENTTCVNFIVFVVFFTYQKHFSLTLALQAAEWFVLWALEVQFHQLLTTISWINYDRTNPRLTLDCRPRGTCQLASTVFETVLYFTEFMIINLTDIRHLFALVIIVIIKKYFNGII